MFFWGFEKFFGKSFGSFPIKLGIFVSTDLDTEDLFVDLKTGCEILHLLVGLKMICTVVDYLLVFEIGFEIFDWKIDLENTPFQRFSSLIELPLVPFWLFGRWTVSVRFVNSFPFQRISSLIGLRRVPFWLSGG